MIQFVQTISIERACEHEEQRTQSDTINQQDTPSGVSCFFHSSRFPASRGVVEMLSEDGRTILIAATGNIRDFIASRLNEHNELSAKANLAPITSKIIAYPTGSAFESDWIVLERARQVDQSLYKKLNEQNRQSLLVLDRESGSCRVEDSLTVLTTRKVSDVVVGPAMTKKAAADLADTLIDVYELCRFPKELAQAPNGTACTYKEMGRCPAACDGSEPMHAYESRFDQAIKTAKGGIELWKRTIQDQITQASIALEFEQAHQASRQSEQIQRLNKETLALAKETVGFACLCVSPCTRRGWAQLWVFDASGLTPLMCVEEHALNDDTLMKLVLTSIFQRAYTNLSTPEPQECADGWYDQVWFDRFSLLARHRMIKPSKAKRRRVGIHDLRDELDCKELIRLITDACTPSIADTDEEERTHIQA